MITPRGVIFFIYKACGVIIYFLRQEVTRLSFESLSEWRMKENEKMNNDLHSSVGVSEALLEYKKDE